MSSSPTAFLDSYESLDVIGNGSFGIIRKVRRKSDGLLFARKELNFERMTERDRKQIVAEVNILKDLHHDHIVRYHDRYVDRDAGILYILMEYCGGGDLSTVIKQAARSGRPIPEDTVWGYFFQILHALQHCHHPNGHARSSSGGSTGTYDSVSGGGNRRPQILHRDLKPDNVFLDEENKVKLGDFGLSKALPQASFASTYVGTPYYMSPELMQEKAYDSKSDIWSLGCLIYELCALKPPFHEAKTHSELSIFIRNGRIPPLPRGYSQALSSVIKSMLNLNPAMRPSAAQLLQHERLELVSKVQETEKMLTAVKQHRSAVAAKEREVLSRESAIADSEAHLQALLSDRDAQIATLQRHLAQAQQQQQHATYTHTDVQAAARAAVAAREDELRTLVAQREAEVAQAIAAREAEIMEAVRAREAEVDAACVAREAEIAAAFEARAQEVEARAHDVEARSRWVLEREEEVTRKEEELRRREEVVARDEARIEEVKRTIEKEKEAGGKKSGGGKSRKEKSPLEEVKNVLQAQATPTQSQQQRSRRATAPSAPAAQPPHPAPAPESSQPQPSQQAQPVHTAPKSFPTLPTHTVLATPAAARGAPVSWAPASAMKGVVLTATGETLATPAPGEFARRLAAAGGGGVQQTPLVAAMTMVTPRPNPVELGTLFEKSPKVGLNFARIFDFESGSGNAKETRARPQPAALDVGATREDDGEGEEELPPSPSVRTQKTGMERSRGRRAEDRDDVSETSSGSGGPPSTGRVAVAAPPPTRIRRPSIRSSSRSGNGKSTAEAAAAASLGVPRPQPLPHPHLRPSASNTNLRTSAAAVAAAAAAAAAASTASPTISATIPAKAPEYDLADEENLPSPFLRRGERGDRGVPLTAGGPLPGPNFGAEASGSSSSTSTIGVHSNSNSHNSSSHSNSNHSSTNSNSNSAAALAPPPAAKRRPSSGLLLRAVAAANNAGRRTGHSPVLADSAQFDAVPATTANGSANGAGSNSGESGTRPSLASARKASEDARKALLRGQT